MKLEKAIGGLVVARGINKGGEPYLITSTPIKGRNTSGTTTLPSAC